MIVIETKEEWQATASSANRCDLANILNFDRLLIDSKPLRCLTAFAKGVLVSCFMFALANWDRHNNFALLLTAYMSASFVAMECCEQKLEEQRGDSRRILRNSLRSINANTACFGIVPAFLMMLSMNFQSLMVGISNLVEVVGISCGVPLLIFGVIKAMQKSAVGKTHFYVGTASALGGIAISVLVNFAMAKVPDICVFSASTYFSDAIVAIYGAPDVVLSEGQN